MRDRVVVWTLIIGVFFTAPPAAGAEEPTPDVPSRSAPDVSKPSALDLPNRFMLRGGYGYTFNASTSFTLNGPHTVSGNVDYELSLGGDP
ncbi:MAG: hypothetical protein ACRELZ_19450 [Candidatus Rokuibacteriota bacterium]